MYGHDVCPEVQSSGCKSVEKPMSIAAVQKEMEDLKAETERWKQQSNTHYMQICALDKDLADLRDKDKVLVDVEWLKLLVFWLERTNGVNARRFKTEVRILLAEKT
jgi:hypothetical protein